MSSLFYKFKVSYEVRSTLNNKVLDCADLEVIAKARKHVFAAVTDEVYVQQFARLRLVLVEKLEQRYVKLETALAWIQESSAVIHEDGTVTYADIPDPDDCFEHCLALKWVDEEGQEFHITYPEGINEFVRWDGDSNLFFISEGETEPDQITLLAPMKLSLRV